MKTLKLLTLAYFVMLASCSPVPQEVTSTTKYTETVKPTSTTLIPTKISQATNKITATPTATEELPSIYAMSLDNMGYVWIATSIDVIRWNIETSQYTRYKYKKNPNSDGQIISMVSDSNGSILALLTDGKAMKLTDGIWTTIVTTKELLDGRINIQPDGTIWIASGYSGAYQYNGKSLKHIQTPKQFNCGFDSIIEGNGELWAIDGICTKEPTYLRKYADARWTEIGGYFPEKLFTDKHGNVWFLDSHAGIIRADLSDKIAFPTKEYLYYSDSVFAPDDSLWLASYQNGIYRFSNRQWSPIDTGYTIDNITCIVIGKDGSVYIGTDGYGMFRFAKSTWSHYTLK